MRNIIAAAFKQKLLSISAPSHSAAAETVEKTGVDSLFRLGFVHCFIFYCYM